MFDNKHVLFGGKESVLRLAPKSFDDQRTWDLLSLYVKSLDHTA